MLCSNCGSKIDGKFCSNCGFKVITDEIAIGDWSREIRYDTLLRIPEVRGLISHHARIAQKGVSAEAFLEIADTFIPLLSNIAPISLGKMGHALKPIALQLGINTGKEVSVNLAQPIGRVIVATLCSLAHHGQTVRSIRQFDTGCFLEASIPSDMWSWEGVFFISIKKQEGSTNVEAATKIEGQMYDWGKSKRILDSLIEDLNLFRDVNVLSKA